MRLESRVRVYRRRSCNRGTLPWPIIAHGGLLSHSPTQSSGPNGLQPISCPIGVFYEQVTEVKICSLFFLLLGFCFCCCLGLRRMLLSTGFLFALLVSFSEARCRLGFSRRIDAAIYRTASKAKTPPQSSEHGVVATGKQKLPQAASA